jgi:N-acyl-D-amino-acid deacylase
MTDYLIKNVRIIDGSGKPGYQGSILIKGDKIAQIWSEAVDCCEDGIQIIDGDGLCACPGFIDMHSHSSLAYLDKPDIFPKMHQGVTSEVIGVDGLSVYPMSPEYVQKWRNHLAGLEGDPDLDWSWKTLSDYIKRLPDTGTNPIPLVGHGNIRLAVMGMEQRFATPEELEKMCDLLDQCFREGAWGLSTGLVYSPATYSDLAELKALGKVCAKHDRFFVFHMRYEGPRVLESIMEVAEIGRESGCKVHISHLKGLGKKAYGKAPEICQKIEEIQASGVYITADVYPYTAASTMMPVILPPWVHAVGPEEIKKVLTDPASLARIEEEMKTGFDEWESFSAAAGWENIYVSSVATSKNQSVVGKNVVQIAEAWGVRPFEAAIRLLLEEDFAVGMVFFVMDEKDVETIIKAPWVMFCTDGLLGGRPHPRTYATFARIISEYVKKRGIITLEEAVRKSTSLTAETLVLKDRGLLSKGYAADICVFDFDELQEGASYDKPDVHPAGIKHVFVNGNPVIFNGKSTGNRPGKALLRK